jgi:hypothetical protein
MFTFEPNANADRSNNVLNSYIYVSVEGILPEKVSTTGLESLI